MEWQQEVRGGRDGFVSALGTRRCSAASCHCWGRSPRQRRVCRAEGARVSGTRRFCLLPGGGAAGSGRAARSDPVRWALGAWSAGLLAPGRRLLPGRRLSYPPWPAMASGPGRAPCTSWACWSGDSSRGRGWAVGQAGREDRGALQRKARPLGRDRVGHRLGCPQAGGRLGNPGWPVGLFGKAGSFGLAVTMGRDETLLAAVLDYGASPCSQPWAGDSLRAICLNTSSRGRRAVPSPRKHKATKRLTQGQGVGEELWDGT